MTINPRKLLSNQALSLEERVAVARLKRAGIKLSGDLRLRRLKVKTKARDAAISETLVRSLAGG